jgi:hypothetical protein
VFAKRYTLLVWRTMLYWECKRRLSGLREFRMQAVDYFENITYAGWMAGGAPLPMNEPAQKARHNMNRVLGDVLVSLSRMNVPHVVNYQPPPRMGGIIIQLLQRES